MRARPPFDVRGGGGVGGSNLAKVEMAHPITLVPGYNCAAARCPLPTLEADESSTWLVPLGSRSEDQIKNELKALGECVSGPADGVEEEGDSLSVRSGSSGKDSNAENKDSKNVEDGGEEERKVKGKGKKKKADGGERKGGVGRGGLPLKRHSVSARSSIRGSKQGGGEKPASSQGTRAGQAAPTRPERMSTRGLRRSRGQQGRGGSKAEEQQYEDIFSDAKQLIAAQLAQIGAGGVGLQKRGPAPGNLGGLETTLYAAQKAFNFEQALEKQRKGGRK